MQCWRARETKQQQRRLRTTAARRAAHAAAAAYEYQQLPSGVQRAAGWLNKPYAQPAASRHQGLASDRYRRRAAARAGSAARTLAPAQAGRPPPVAHLAVQTALRVRGLAGDGPPRVACDFVDDPLADYGSRTLSSDEQRRARRTQRRVPRGRVTCVGQLFTKVLRLASRNAAPAAPSARARLRQPARRCGLDQ